MADRTSKRTIIAGLGLAMAIGLAGAGTTPAQAAPLSLSPTQAGTVLTADFNPAEGASALIEVRSLNSGHRGFRGSQGFRGRSFQDRSAGRSFGTGVFIGKKGYVGKGIIRRKGVVIK